MEIGADAMSDEPRIFGLVDLVDAYSAEAISNYDRRRKGIQLGPTTPLTDLNEALGGHFRPGLYILHAAPGAGKSMLALQVAAQCGYPAVFATLEMSAVENVARLMAMATNTPRKALLSGRMDVDSELQILEATAQQFPKLAIAEAVGLAVKPDMLRRWVYVNQKSEKHALLVVDSLHVWAFSVADTFEATEKQILDEAIKHLRRIAGDLKIPIIAIAERNRYSMERGGMSAASGSARIEYSADVVLSLATDGTTRNVPGATGRTMKAELSKNRFGEPKTVRLYFDPAYMKFSSVETHLP